MRRYFGGWRGALMFVALHLMVALIDVAVRAIGSY